VGGGHCTSRNGKELECDALLSRVQVYEGWKLNNLCPFGRGVNNDDKV
jgi:hypothetical protein